MNKDVVLYDADGREIEPEPEISTALTYNEDNLKHLETVADGIERFVEAQIKIQRVILKLAKPGDWVIFGESACLSGPGTERIAAALGMSFFDFLMKKEEGNDNKYGKFYVWTTTCKAKFGGREIEAIGQCGSRNKFFGYKDKEWRPIEDIDEQNIKMASRRNAMKEGVRLLLGLRNIPIEELTKAGIKFAYGKKVDFKSDVKSDKKPDTNGKSATVPSGSKPPDDKKDLSNPDLKPPAEKKETPEALKKYEKLPDTLDGIKTQIGQILMDITDQSIEQSRKLLKEISSFYVKDKDTKEEKLVEGKESCADLSDKQLHTVRGKALKLLENKEEK